MTEKIEAIGVAIVGIAVLVAVYLGLTVIFILLGTTHKENLSLKERLKGAFISENGYNHGLVVVVTAVLTLIVNILLFVIAG